MMSKLFVNFSCEPNENYHKTKEGICLLRGVLGRPVLAGTPFGAYFFDTKFDKFNFNWKEDNKKYQEILRENFTLSFCSNLGEKKEDIIFYLGDVSHEISKKDLDKYRNTSEIIFSNLDHRRTKIKIRKNYFTGFVRLYTELIKLVKLNCRKRPLITRRIKACVAMVSSHATKWYNGFGYR